VFQTEDGGVVRVEIAGLASASVDMSYEGGRLLIAGTRREPETNPIRRCALKEIASGRFHVDVAIPWRVDTRRVQVSYADGFLTVVLPSATPAGGTERSAPAA
jgi:HSP20 family molecular chaperone IbpA